MSDWKDHDRLRRAAIITEGIMGKQASENDPLAYWTLINTLLQFADTPKPLKIRATPPAPEEQK